MNTDRLRYFAAVVETRNLRKAAELVGIAPASMSKAISTLEDELGHKLLRPDGRGIEITEKGIEVYRKSSSLLEEFKRFLASLSESNLKTQKLRLATFEVFSSYFMAAFLENNYRDSDVLLLELAPGEIERSVLDGLVEYGLTYLPSPNPALDFVEVGSFKMGIFGKNSWMKSDFSKWPFAIPITELRIHSSDYGSLDMWPKNAPKRLVKFEFELLESMLQTCGNNLSVLHCPDFIVKLYNYRVKSSFFLDQLPYPSKYGIAKSVKVFLVRRKTDTNLPLEQKLAKFMRSLK